MLSGRQLLLLDSYTYKLLNPGERIRDNHYFIRSFVHLDDPNRVHFLKHRTNKKVAQITEKYQLSNPFRIEKRDFDIVLGYKNTSVNPRSTIMSHNYNPFAVSAHDLTLNFWPKTASHLPSSDLPG